MDLSTWTLFGVVTLLAVNQVVMRVPALLTRSGLFFGLLALELVVGTVIIALGLPGFEQAPMVRWVVGLLFFLHVAQNLSVRPRRLAAAGAARDQARQERAEALRERLRDEE